MGLEAQLIELEKQFWTAGPAFYRGHVDERCMIAFAEMAGVMSRDQIASSVTEESRWRDVSIEPVGLIDVDGRVAIFTYRAQAVSMQEGSRAGELYRALVSSVYTKRGEEWKLTFHQQTPLKDQTARAGRFPKQDEKDMAGGQHGTRNIGGSRSNPGTRTH